MSEDSFSLAACKDQHRAKGVGQGVESDRKGQNRDHKAGPEVPCGEDVRSHRHTADWGLLPLPPEQARGLLPMSSEPHSPPAPRAEPP